MGITSANFKKTYLNQFYLNVNLLKKQPEILGECIRKVNKLENMVVMVFIVKIFKSETQ
jgi:hypothetical protein